MCIPKTQQHTSGAAAWAAGWDAASRPSDPGKNPAKTGQRDEESRERSSSRTALVGTCLGEHNQEGNASLSHGRASGLGKREPRAAVCLSIHPSVHPRKGVAQQGGSHLSGVFSKGSIKYGPPDLGGRCAGGRRARGAQGRQHRLLPGSSAALLPAQAGARRGFPCGQGLPWSQPTPAQLFAQKWNITQLTSLELQGKCDVNQENLGILQEA